MAFPDYSRIDAATVELAGQSDRAAALVGASLLEHELTECIRAVLVETGSNAEGLLSSKRNGPLGTFNAKIEASYFFGLIPRDLANSLHLVRDTRNDFAHSFSRMSFDDPKLKDRLRSFPAVRVLLVQIEAHRRSEEGRALISRLRLDTNRRLWEITIGDLYLRLQGVLMSRGRIPTPPSAYADIEPMAARIEELYRDNSASSATESRSSGAPLRLLSRSKPIAAVLFVAGMALPLLLGRSWVESFGVGAVLGVSTLAIGSALFRQAIRPPQK